MSVYMKLFFKPIQDERTQVFMLRLYLRYVISILKHFYKDIFFYDAHYKIKTRLVLNHFECCVVCLLISQYIFPYNINFVVCESTTHIFCRYNAWVMIKKKVKFVSLFGSFLLKNEVYSFHGELISNIIL